MASRAIACWRSMLTRSGGNRSFATATEHSAHPNANQLYKKYSITGEFAPVYVVLGMVMVAVTIGTHSLKQQLVHCPNVSVTKKKRRAVSEVEEPDHVVNSSDKFVNKSFLRKVAHIQDNNRTLPDPVRSDPFSRPRDAETLKKAGVQ